MSNIGRLKAAGLGTALHEMAKEKLGAEVCSLGHGQWFDKGFKFCPHCGLELEIYRDCPTCGKRFFSIAAFKLHATGHPKTACPNCQSKYNVSRLKETDNYYCRRCSTKFSWNRELGYSSIKTAE